MDDKPIPLIPDTARVADLRARVRAAMERQAVPWEGPARIDARYMDEPLAVRKARAIALKLSHMPTELWAGQLFAASMTLEEPRLHYERPFPDYLTDEERQAAAQEGLSIRSVFGHIVPDYATLVAVGLAGIRAEAEAQQPLAENESDRAFLRSVILSLDAVMDYAARLADRCESEAEALAAQAVDEQRAEELHRMAANLRQAPAGPALSFWQALQSVWLLHLVFHSTLNGNAVGRLDQYAWPLLEADLAAGRLDLARAGELVDCFCLKFNERAQTNEEQLAGSRPDEGDKVRRTRHTLSSQVRSHDASVGPKTWLQNRPVYDRDRVDATNHWLQNIVVSGLTPEGVDGTNPLTYLLLDSYRRNEMTNPLLTVRVHRNSPPALLERTCEAIKQGGGMPALFNDEQIVRALERAGIPTPHARDYTNDGCWEVIVPGRTDFRFARISMMLPLEWTLRRGRSWWDGQQAGLDTGDARAFTGYEQLWNAYLAQLDAVVGWLVAHEVAVLDQRAKVAPVPLLSALIDGAIPARRDMTAGGARYRTFGMLAESAAHAIDSLTAIKSVVFEQGEATMADLCDALEADFEGDEVLRRKLQDAPKYGNDDPRADAVGRALIEAFTGIVDRHAQAHQTRLKFPCGVGTFSWYVGIGEGLGASPDGRLAGQPVSSNFSPALGRDMAGLPSAILSYAKMQNYSLPAGGPLDLRLARRLVRGPAGTQRMMALVRGFVETEGAMMTLTVADTEELRAAQREPENYQSLRVRMGGWCAYFTMLSEAQQEHHIQRQENQS